MSLFDKPTEPSKEVLPRYCNRSGDRLEVAREDRGYDTQTGDKAYVYWLSCPNAPRKDTPYDPYGFGRARFVNCEGTRWAEGTGYGRGFRDCTPWPESVRLATDPVKAAE